MAENLTRVGIAMTERERAMLDELARARYPHGYRMQSATVRELIAEEYARMKARENAEAKR